MDERFPEEFFEPDDAEQAGQDAFLQKYYDEVFSTMLSYNVNARSAELFPYEIAVFSDQPGVLANKSNY